MWTEGGKVKLVVAAIQMTCQPLEVERNLSRAEAHLRAAHEAGARIAVLPEMFNTGYGLQPDYTPLAETISGPTIQRLLELSARWNLIIAGGFVERDTRHLYDSLALCLPDGNVHVYRKRHLVFWERFRFYPGRDPVIVPTSCGRIGLAICADMIYRNVWETYRDRIDLALIASAWPDFTCRHTGRRDWLLGHVGPLSGEIPCLVARDLGIPVIFANQCGETRTTIPLIHKRIADRFAGRSAICDGRHGISAQADAAEQVVLGSITIHTLRGPHSCRTTSPSGIEVRSSGLARS
jgi:N-carbamoylputrescine amidase